MKKITHIRKSAYQLCLVLLAVFSLSSCENEFGDETTVGGSNEPPVITSVNEAREGTPVTQGVLENTYIIRGENLSTLQSISFNGYRAGFNPALLTDKLAFVTIPEDAPYVKQSNTLRLENSAGVTEYDFSLLTIVEFTEELIDGRSAVVLHGGDFSDVEEVIFSSGTEEDGNLEERDADILSVTDTEVTVAVPDGVVQAFIYVYTTRGAIVQSSSYGFNYPIYTDGLNAWELGGWGEPQEESSEIALGASSVKKTTGQWEGLTFTPAADAEPLVFSDYTTMAVSIYPEEGVTRIKLRVNDEDLGSNNAETDYYKIDVVPGQWNKIVLELKSFYPTSTPPEEITRIDFQCASEGAGNVYFVDQFGFVQ